MPLPMESTAYPKTLRLRARADFQRVVGHGLIYPGRECLVRVYENGLGHPRLGIATPRRYGKAVRRNRFRRLVRAAFRSIQTDLAGYDVMVSPRKGLTEPTLEGLLQDLARAPGNARPQHARHGPQKRRR
jgi:ribonuclease P protein component